MQSFEDFLERLDSASWSPAGYIDGRVADLLGELRGKLMLLHQEVASWADGNLEERGLRSHETTTHYKWFVFYHSTLSYRVWLHQYKPFPERTLGHAEVPHNHRYSLASLVVAGGFDHHVFARRGQELIELTKSRRSLTAGDTFVVHCDQVHKLSNLQDRTLTMVVESPVVRHYSEAFYESGNAPRRIYDFAGLHSSLREVTEGLRLAR